MTILGASNNRLFIGSDGVIRRYGSAQTRWPFVNSITLAERNALTALDGLFFGFEIYVSDLAAIQTYTTTGWQSAGAGGGGSGSLAFGLSTLPAMTQGTAVATSAAVSGGTAPVAYTITAGVLPAGLSLNAATGAITGTPTTPGAYGFTVTATDSSTPTPLIASQTYTGTVAAGAILTLSPASGAFNAPIGTDVSGFAITATGGTGPYTFTFSGTFPTGTTLSTGGISSGIVAGTIGDINTATVTATDSLGATGTATYVYTTVAAVVIPLTTLPSLNTGAAASASAAATGGSAPTTYAVTAGTLPTGLALNAATGAITGTPTTPGAYSFTVTATDSSTPVAGTTSQTYTGTVDGPLTIGLAAMPTLTVGTASSASINATGGTDPITYSVDAFSLPPGLTLNTTTGVISGTPTVAGAYSFTVYATDSASPTNVVASQTYTGTVASALVIGLATIPNTTTGTAVSVSVAATGGTAPITYTVDAFSLPPGLTLNSATGEISGTPTTAGTYTVTVYATDSATPSAVVASQTYTVIVSAMTIMLTFTSDWMVNVAIDDVTATVSGAVGAVTFAVSSGALPAGISLNTTTGVISGTPTAVGPYTFTISATDTAPTTVYQTYTGTIDAATSEDEDMPKIAPEIFYASGTWTKPTTAPGNTATWAKVEIWNAGLDGNAGGTGGALAEYWIDFTTLGATVAVTVAASGSGGTSSFGTRTTANAVAAGAKMFPGGAAHPGGVIDANNNQFAMIGGKGGGAYGGEGGGARLISAAFQQSGSRPGGGGGYSENGPNNGSGGAGMVIVTLI